ncbi:hypothetical protein HHK36_029839 [Tetracentron sinense]|uniref:Uncharacterized protein n=1 Tax=Tetracentron sinense TaxID=13715 RepID=A0A834YE97_TETSI|nr:hypothetical protein HHK36_029839 [Tetracentron sinense]
MLWDAKISPWAKGQNFTITENSSLSIVLCNIYMTIVTIPGCLKCFSLEEHSGKIKGLVRNTKKVEAEIAALKISYVKKLMKAPTLGSSEIQKLCGMGFITSIVLVLSFGHEN